MIGIVAASHHFQPIGDGDTLPTLDNLLKNLCQEPFRRIDRFIQLGLLGSSQCAAGHTLRPDCGIYLGSGLGPMSNNIAVQEQMIRNREIPRPFNFINTLGSSAGFYIAKNLGLCGQNFFISRRGASLEAALSAAMADLMLGVSGQALVGVVEEVTLPLAAHCQRQDLSAGTPVAEGSHWLLLQAGVNGRGTLDLKRFAEFAELENFLKSVRRASNRVCCALNMERRMQERLQKEFSNGSSLSPNTPFHDSVEAAWVTEFVADQSSGNLFLISGAPERGWLLFHFHA